MAKVLTGDETGLLKVVSLRKKEILCNWGEQTREHEIQALTWVSLDGHSSFSSAAYCATVNKSGNLEVWDSLTGNRIHLTKNAGCGSTILLTMYKGYYLVCGAKSARLIPQDCTDTTKNSSVKEIVFASDIASAAVHHDAGLLAVGGKDHELTLFDLDSCNEAWKAKNVPFNKLDRRVPVWVTGIAFLPDPDAAVENYADIVLSKHLIGVVTGYRHVRIYDTRLSQQPIRNMDEVGPRHFTACALSNDGKSLIVGDTTGSLYRVAIENLKVTGAYKGCVGSIRSIAVHPRLPYFAATGLDRHVRVFNTETRQLIRRLYLKQRLNVVAFVPSNTTEVTSLIPEGPHPKAGGKAVALKLREITERKKEGKVDPIIALEEAMDKEKEEDEFDEAVWRKLEEHERANKLASNTSAGKKRRLDSDDSHESDESEDDEDAISDFDSESDDDDEEFGLFDSDDDDDETNGDDDDDDEDTAFVDNKRVAFDLRKEVKDSQRQKQRNSVKKNVPASKRKY